MAQLHLIVAHARNGVIGKEGKLPWYLPEDLKHFKRTTLGKPVIMGRKTWESLGRPLPGRRNIVVTRQTGFTAEGAEVYSNLQDAVAAVKDEPIAFIMGGAQIYAEAMPQIEGDAFFKPLTDDEWNLVEEATFPATDTHPYSFSIRRYERR